MNPSYHPSYIAIPVPDSLPTSSQPKLRPVRDLPTHCLDQYYSLGDICHDGLGPVPLDVVWTWVNGSDPLFSDAREQAAQSYDRDDPYRPIKSNNPSRMFRYVAPFVLRVRSCSHVSPPETTTNFDIPYGLCWPTFAHIPGVSAFCRPILTILRKTRTTPCDLSQIRGLDTGG